MVLAQFETGFITTLATKLNPSDVTMNVATAPTITSGRVFIQSWTQKEWIKYTGVTPWTPAVLTGLVRQLSTTASPSVSLGNGYVFLAGTQITIVVMGDELTDRLATANTWPLKQTFGDVDVTGTLNMWSVWDLNVLGTSNPQPNFVDLAALQAFYTSPLNGDKGTANGVDYSYNWYAAQWEAKWVSTPVPNAAVWVAGKVQIGTALTNADSTGWVYNQTPNAAIKSYVDSVLNNFWSWLDWDVVISVNTTLSSDMYYNNLTINNGIILYPAWYKIFVKWTLLNNGTISRNGNAWSDWSQPTLWAWAIALSSWTLWTCLWWGDWAAWRNQVAGVWWVWVAGWASTPSWSNVNGSAWWAGEDWGGYSGWAWWWAGTTTRGSLYNVVYDLNKLLSIITTPWLLGNDFSIAYKASAWSGGWWAWGCGYIAWGWGWGGWVGWIIYIAANIFNNTSGIIEAKWGKGGNGWNGNSSGWWGWGGGWAWWVIIYKYHTLTSAWTMTVSWWAPGTKWTGWSGWWTNWTVWSTWVTIALVV